VLLWVGLVLLVERRGGGPHVDLGLLVDALIGVGAAVREGVDAVRLHPIVDLSFVAGAVEVDQALVVPTPVFFRSQALAIPLAHGAQRVAVRIPRLVVDRKIDRHAHVYVCLHVLFAPGGPLATGDLQRDRELHLAGELGVLALLRTLHRVPE